jgi:hypothetical protein
VLDGGRFLHLSVHGKRFTVHVFYGGVLHQSMDDGPSEALDHGRFFYTHNLQRTTDNVICFFESVDGRNEPIGECWTKRSVGRNEVLDVFEPIGSRKTAHGSRVLRWCFAPVDGRSLPSGKRWTKRQ